MIYESTVYSGCTDEVCVPILEAESGLTLNKISIAGTASSGSTPDKLHRLRHHKNCFPDQSATSLLKHYTEIIDAGVYVAESVKVAEAAKVIENTCDLNIALINELSMIFDKMDLNRKVPCGYTNVISKHLSQVLSKFRIGVDPYYLTYKAQDVGLVPRYIGWQGGERWHGGLRSQ